MHIIDSLANQTKWLSVACLLLISQNTVNRIDMIEFSAYRPSSLIRIIIAWIRLVYNSTH